MNSANVPNPNVLADEASTEANDDQSDADVGGEGTLEEMEDGESRGAPERLLFSFFQIV